MSLQPFRTNIKQLVGALTTYFYRRGGGEHGLYAFHPLTTPLTSTSWDGDAKTTGDNAIIDLSSVFSAPAGIKAIEVRMSVDATVADRFARLGPSSTHSHAVICRVHVANILASMSGIVPCDTNGDVYFYANADLASVYIQIYGYWL